MAAGDGLVSMTPTSIAHSGTSASINADGGVDFSAVTSLSLNGVFTSDYDNYLIVARWDIAPLSDPAIRFRLRTGGSDDSGTNYSRQYFAVSGTSVSAERNTSQAQGTWSDTSEDNVSGSQLHVYGPYLAQPTAFRGVHVSGYTSGYFFDVANTHSLSTSYDSITFFTSSSTTTGNVHVFGYEE